MTAAGPWTGEAAGVQAQFWSCTDRINRLFAKLGARDRAQAVIAAYEHRYITPGQ